MIIPNANSDLCAEQMRLDFEEIWKQNISEVELIKEINPDAGDYFSNDDSSEINKKIWVNIQGRSSQDYKRIVAGIISPDATYHVYVRWNERINNNDVIVYKNQKYRIQNMNESIHGGEVIFIEFDLKRIDHY